MKIKPNKLTKRDKEIINSILTYIGSNDDMETELATYMAKPEFDMTEDEFSDWLSMTVVK